MLLNKLFAFGIHASFLNWIGSYLTSRSESVYMSYHISNDFIINSGVFQGSHSGLILFILFVNNLLIIFDNSVNILLFADDAKIFSIVKSPTDSLILQSNLNELVIWSCQNYLTRKMNKYNVITFSRLDNNYP